MFLIAIGRPGTARATDYGRVYQLHNVQTNDCLTDLGADDVGLTTRTCDDLDDRQMWAYTHDKFDSSGKDIGTFQNIITGQCLDDSAAYGLRAYQCDVHHDASRIFQQFKTTFHRPPNLLTFQNMATGSCVDDSSFGLRGYFCNGTYYQDWTENTFYRP